MMKIFALALALLLMAGIGTGEENMDYRILGGRARVIGNDVVLTDVPGGESICTIEQGEILVLMGEKSDGSYTLVNYQGKRGFVAAEYLDIQRSIGGMGLDKILTAQDWHNISAFITTFTRAGLTDAGEGYFSAETGDAALLDAIISGEAEEISGPFAIADHVSDMEDGTYRVRFKTFGAGKAWTDDDLSMSVKTAQEKYPEMGYGWAQFAAEDLANPATYSIIEMVQVN